MVRIKVTDIGPEGLNLDLELPAEFIGYVKEKYLEFVEPFKLNAELKKISDKIIVTANLKGEFKSECNRCLEPLKIPLDREFTFAVDVDRTTEFVDISDEIRDEVLLFLPEKILCRDDCKGLCPTCGQNLNQKECDCHRDKNQNNAEIKESINQPFRNLKIK